MHWLNENWSHFLPSPWRESVLSLIAVVLGGLIGNERMHKEKAVGMRTMALVSLGSAAFTMIGFAFTSSTGDSGRVAAQIVTGIGFLGGGVIMRGPGSIFGVTTAAMIWVTAAIGMAIGAGYPFAGFGLTVLVLAAMKIVGHWEHTYEGGGRAETVTIIFRPDHGKTLIKIEKIAVEYGVLHDPAKLKDIDGDRKRIDVDYRLPAHRNIEFLGQLAAMPEIEEINRKRGGPGA